MNRLLILAAVFSAAIAACTTSAPAPATSTERPSASSSATAASPYALAMTTVSELCAAGNIQAAIQRLVQLAGDVTLTPTERSEVLLQLGDLSAGAGGYDLVAARSYYEEVLRDFPASAAAAKAGPALAGVKAQIASLEKVLASASASRTDRFNALMTLGRHDEAIDLMVAHDLTPSNDVLLAMYQIGYLCDDPSLTGRPYSVTDRDGTRRMLRFCDLGK